MAVNINLARQKVEAVRTETEDFANTALRVGGAMSDILEYAHEEKLRAEESESTILRAVAQNAGEIRALKSGSATKGELLVEEERAKAAEQAIRDSVESLSEDFNAASEDISKLEVALEAEKSRAKGAEQALSTEITEAENRVDERVTEVRDDLEAEAQARSEAEDDLNANTGISEYPTFDPAVDYSVGDVVKYEGRLRRFVAEHAAGEWNAEQVEEWSEKKEIDEKVTDLSYPQWLDINNSTIRNENKPFLMNVGNLNISGFDKSLPLGITSFVKNHPTYGNRINFAWKKDGEWVYGSQARAINFNDFEFVIDGVTYNISISVESVPGGEVLISQLTGVPEILINDKYDNYISLNTFKQLEDTIKELVSYPQWLDINNSKLRTSYRTFLENIGNINIEGFDKSLPLGITYFDKGYVDSNTLRIRLAWYKNDNWVQGTVTSSSTDTFQYAIDGKSYILSIDSSKLPNSSKAYVSLISNGADILMNSRYTTYPNYEHIKNELLEEIGGLEEKITASQIDIYGNAALPILKNIDDTYSAKELLIISAIKNVGFYDVPETIKEDDIFVRSFCAQSAIGNGAHGQMFYIANKRIYNETQDWNAASILIAPKKVCDYQEHEFDVTVSSGEMQGMRIRILVDYSVFVGQEFYYGTSNNNKVIFNLDREWKENIQDRFAHIEEQINEEDKIYNDVPMEQRNIVWIGSSNVWGDGFLFYSYLRKPIEWLYKSTGRYNGAADVECDGEIVTNTKKYLDGTAIKIEGVGTEIKFKHRGSELNVCQVIERTSNYAVIGVYNGDNKVAEFTNHNRTIGSDTAAFTGDGNIKRFDLDRCFTYNHTLTVGGVSKTIELNTQGYGASFPDGVDCLVIRAMNDEGTKVIHSLWFKEAPTGDIVVSYDYGETICFVKSTVGETAEGANESAYGEGTISYDPTNPVSNIGSGLDFRLVNENAFFKYWFKTDEEREITLKIERGSNPYFIFNFASSVYHNVMNAGIGGYMAYTFNTKTDLTAWYNIAEHFTPDFVSIGLTGNDDFRNFPRKISRVVNMTLDELREYPSLEIGKIEYVSASDTYDVTINSGVIAEITPRSLKSSSIVGSDVAVGDFARIGTYTGDLRQVQTRRVESVDNVNGVITWVEPLHLNEFICIDSLQELVGQDVSIRSIEQYMDNMEQLVTNILSINPKCKVCLFNVYYVDMWIRNTAEYTYIQQWITSKFSANVFVIDAWKYSRDWVECSSKSRTLTFTTDGSDTILFDSPSNLGHWEGFEVWIDDENVYGKDCYPITGYKNTVAPNKSGAELNWEGVDGYLRPNTENGQMAIKWKRNIPISGKTVTIKMAYLQWSSDWGHPNQGDYIDNSLGRAMIYALKK